MNYKHLLKFYFFADGLNGAMDSLTFRLAKASADCFNGCEYYAEKICRVIEAKNALNALWLFLDNAMGTMTESDRLALKAYSQSRGKRGGETLEKEEAKAEHRALMKFSRRMSGRLEKYAEQVKVLREYYCLIGSGERSDSR